MPSIANIYIYVIKKYKNKSAIIMKLLGCVPMSMEEVVYLCLYSLAKQFD